MNTDAAYNQLPIPDWLGLTCPQCQYPLRGLPSHRCPECGLLLDMEELTKLTFVPLRPPMITADTRPVPDFGFECPSCDQPLAGLANHQCPECGEEFDLNDFIPAGQWPVLLHKDAPTAELLAISLHNEGLPVLLGQGSGIVEATAMIYGGSSQPPVRVRRDYYLDALHHLRAERPRVAAWTCPHCQAKVPGHFDICWNCQAERA